MLRLLVLLIALVGALAQMERIFYSLEDAEYHFNEFINTFGKQYASEQERNFRFNIFKENLKKINEKNAMGHAVFGITQFTDLILEEFLQKHTGYRRTDLDDDNYCNIVNTPIKGADPAPDSLDWRHKQKVTKVKSQGFCGSCWAFSTTGNLEGQYAIKYNKLVEFSEQQLVDCDRGSDGCSGGLMRQAFTWLSENGGEETEADYSYKGKNGKCKFDKSKALLQVTGCNKYQNITEDKLKQVLAEVGPLSIAVDAEDFGGYIGGILKCTTNQKLNHGVLLVGYGTEAGKPYWIIKNSWGLEWGEKGYVRVEMYKNSCLMMSDISSAVVA